MYKFVKVIAGICATERASNNATTIRSDPDRAGPGQLQHASHIWHGPQAQVEPAPEAEAEAEAACVFYVQLPTIYAL